MSPQRAIAPGRLVAGFVLFVVALASLAACGPGQAAIDQAVAATRTADKIAADAVATGIAGTLAARPTTVPATVRATATAVSTSLPVCSEGGESIEFLSTAYIRNDQFLITLEKAGPFESTEYTLLVNNSPFDCTQLAVGGPSRIYCTGRPIPPPGQAAVRLLAADSSCAFNLSFSTIPVPPKPQPTKSGGYK